MQAAPIGIACRDRPAQRIVAAAPEPFAQLPRTPPIVRKGALPWKVQQIEEYRRRKGGGPVRTLQAQRPKRIMKARQPFKIMRDDELLQFVRFCLVGEGHPVRLPDVPMYLDFLVSAEFHHGLTPVIDNRHLAVVAIDGFPAESWPGILNVLDTMPLSYRWSSRFMFLDPVEARQKLERTRKKWLQKVRPFMDQLFQTRSNSIDQDAALMVAETEDAIAEANSQLVAYGYYTPVIILFGDDAEQLRKELDEMP